MEERIETDLLVEPTTNTVQFTGNTESIWDLPWIWVTIAVLIIAGLALINRHLTNNKFK